MPGRSALSICLRPSRPCRGEAGLHRRLPAGRGRILSGGGRCPSGCRSCPARPRNALRARLSVARFPRPSCGNAPASWPDVILIGVEKPPWRRPDRFAHGQQRAIGAFQRIRQFQIRPEGAQMVRRSGLTLVGRRGAPESQRRPQHGVSDAPCCRWCYRPALCPARARRYRCRRGRWHERRDL